MQTSDFDMSEYSGMVATLAKPGEAILSQLTPQYAHLWHMATGIMGEMTEALLAYLYRDYANMEEELGDTEFYFEGNSQGIGRIFTSRAVLVQNNEWDSVGTALQNAVIAAGEVLDRTKKLIIYNDENRMEGIIEWMGILRERLDKLYTLTGISRIEALKHNQNKLVKGKNARYAGGNYSDEAAQKRADKPEGE